MEDKHEPDVSLSSHPFIRHFEPVAHVILTSCTRQDVLGCFASLDSKTREKLYKIYSTVVAQIRENVIAEFGSVCKEHQVLEVLDHNSERTAIGAVEVSDRVHPDKVSIEMVVGRKLQEVDEMRKRLEQVKEENRVLAAQLEPLRVDMKEANDQSSINDSIEKTRDVNLKFMAIM